MSNLAHSNNRNLERHIDLRRYSATKRRHGTLKAQAKAQNEAWALARLQAKLFLAKAQGEGSCI
jgi:hypothetical protein